MTFIPFICLGFGLVLGFRALSTGTLRIVEVITDAALLILMLTIGINIGINNSVMSKLSEIGVNCIVISLSAILFSILCTIIVEKTVLPLEKISSSLKHKNLISPDVNSHKNKVSPLMWTMPTSIVTGIIVGYFVIPKSAVFILKYMLTGCLITLYLGIGISLGNNRKVFQFIKILGARVLFLPLAIFTGSILGGIFSGIILNLPYQISVISAAGMSYYSLTGAYMTQTYGIEIGTYGFIVNVIREFFTIISMPVLIRISKGSPMASGASGNMDAMLMPITKFLGPELGLVALITGTIVTFAVPLLLPILNGILNTML